jgi:hypothetical protein
LNGLLALLACFAASSVHADLYGFVDEQGQVHLANRQVDERYQLYQKSQLSGSSANHALDDATTRAWAQPERRQPPACPAGGLKTVPAPCGQPVWRPSTRH